MGFTSIMSRICSQGGLTLRHHQLNLAHGFSVCHTHIHGLTLVQQLCTANHCIYLNERTMHCSCNSVQTNLGQKRLLFLLTEIFGFILGYFPSIEGWLLLVHQESMRKHNMSCICQRCSENCIHETVFDITNWQAWIESGCLLHPPPTQM